MVSCGSILSFCGSRPQLPPMTSAAAAVSSPSSCPSPPSLPLRRRTTACSATGARPPIPPLNPRDSFLSMLASVAAASSEPLTARPASSDPETPPYLDLFDSPNLMATPAQVERSGSYNAHRRRRPPPDLPSLLLDGRIVYIGMPLVPAVTELLIAELMYLQWADPKGPIYLYINSTGTTRDDGQPVGMESEGFAIYDAMMQLKNEIQTVNIGVATGFACLLLAAGKKGRRYMMPHAKAMIQQPRAPSSGLMPASDVIIHAKEMPNEFIGTSVIHNRDTFVELFAKHTGNSVEKVSKVLRGAFYMDSVEAQEFGVIDKILRRGEENVMADVVAKKEWDRGSGSKVVDGM